MTASSLIHGLVGGALIGLAAVLLMLTLGRVAGVSGIALNAMWPGDASGRGWRLAFVAGLPLGALLTTALGFKDWSGVTFAASAPLMIAAGFITGVGVTIGSGCTSGHGVCGLARFSTRSMAATATFMATGIATVFVVRHWI